MLQSTLRAKLSQGDILDGITVWDPVGEGVQPRDARVVVLSHDCELDKPKERGRYVLVVEWRSPSNAGSSNWGNIVRGRGWNALYVPGDSSAGIDDGYVDFGRTQRVQQSALKYAMENGRRVASMSDGGREALIYAFTSYLLHEEVQPEGS
jgi:hypothetical protein